MGYHLVSWYRSVHPARSIQQLTALPSEAFALGL
ncbi:hypothetical protein [Sulfobacillus harzensis]